MSTRNWRSTFRVATYVVIILLLAFGAYLINHPLIWISLAPFVFVLFLFWRGVRALERIAAAMEKDT